MVARRHGSVEVLASAALLLAVLSICREVVAQPQAKPSDHISGIVINSVTREPIPRALVVSEGERFATLTDGSGRFEFVFADTSAGNQTVSATGGAVPSRAMPPSHRPYTLTARKPGFLNSQGEQGQIAQNVMDGRDIEIALVPEALIVGRVTLPTSEPPDPVEVELYGREVRSGHSHWVSMKMEATRSDGRFRFAELRPGSYKLLTHELRDEDPKFSLPGGQAFGYPPVYYPNPNSFASVETIELTPGKTAQVNLTLVKQPYFPVIVPVTNVPPRQMIEVSVQGTGGPGYSLEFDGQKQSIVGLLPNGNYQLRAMGFGDQAISGQANITVHGGAEGAILPLATNPPIRVHVKDEFSSDVSPATTTVMSANGKVITHQRRFEVSVTLEPLDDYPTQPLSASTMPSNSAPDELELDHVAPGRYWVQIYPTNGYVASMTAGGVDLQHHPLMVPAGSSAPSIEVILRNDTATVEGVVEAASGSSAAVSSGPYGPVRVLTQDSGAHLYFIPLPDSPGRFTEQPVNPDGRFSVSLPPGNYRVLAFPQAQPDLEYQNPVAMRPYDAKGQEIRLAGGQKEQIQLQLISTSE